MLDALADIFDVRFEELLLEDGHRIDGWIFPEADEGIQHRLAHLDVPSYAVIRGDRLVPCGRSDVIEFSSNCMLLSLLAGRRIKTMEAAEMKSLPTDFRNMTVLASKAGAPIWAMQDMQGWQHHYVAAPIPELNDDDPLFQYFHGSRFFQVLPLILFLRSLTEDRRWEQPPLQACFMFDDPNLHWRTYGFLDFANIAVHAQAHNYHVAIAMIPLDAWFVHKPTALLFQEFRDQLSLLVHGNDHISKELAIPCSNAWLNTHLRQALRRIAEFERRSGIEVSRVMAPPHGACGERALAEMALMGFEAASVSRRSLRHYNGHAAWIRSFAMSPAVIIAGLPVFPRFPFSDGCHNDILIAALLHQPIIVTGHHHDLANGLQVLERLSEFVNSLGTVHWSPMNRISRYHYAKRFDGKILSVKMFTKRIEIFVPEGTRQIRVDLPWLQSEDSEILAWKLRTEDSNWKFQHPNVPISVLPGQEVQILADVRASPLAKPANVRNFNPWPFLRRQLTEARDRLSPAYRKVSFYSSKTSES